jgi:hypothetical protein
MDIMIAIDKIRCPCQTVLAKSLDAARHQCCKCCFIMNGTSGLRRAVGWRLAGWVGHGKHSRPKHASNQHSCMKETKREISGRSSAMGINRLSPWDPRVLE